MKFLSSILIAFVLVLSTVQASLAGHPAEGKQLSKGAGNVMSENTGYPEGWDINDLTFQLIGEAPIADDLTYLEVYMVCGVKYEKDGKRRAMEPWSSDIAFVVQRFQEEFGYVPSVLDDVAIRQTPGFESKSDTDLEVYRNPLTGAWPRLDASYHSPGDMYIRPLTENEMRHFAALHKPYQERWFDRYSYSRRADSYVNIEMLTQPFYLRVYGYNETLVSRIDYLWREDS